MVVTITCHSSLHQADPVRIAKRPTGIASMPITVRTRVHFTGSYFHQCDKRVPHFVRTPGGAGAGDARSSPNGRATLAQANGLGSEPLPPSVRALRGRHSTRGRCAECRRAWRGGPYYAPSGLAKRKILRT